MSGICGIVNFDGKPVDPDLLKKMAEAAAYRGPDGINYWIQGNVGFAHLALHTTPESVRERQPLVNRRGDLVLTADARVDNRDELIRTLTSKGYLEEKDPTDADLILAAYEAWGEECPKYIIGDFAFAVWDARRQVLLVVRDRTGSKPVYHRSLGDVLEFASEAVQLLVDPAYPVRLDEVMIARDLARPNRGGAHRSYYQDISKLGPAEHLTRREGSLKSQPYWTFNPERRIRYSSEGQYVDHFIHVLREAIRARLRSLKPPLLFLSGGLDSTSIAAIASDEHASSHSHIRGLRAVTWIFELAPEANESSRSRMVASQWGFSYDEVLADSLWTLVDHPERVIHRDDPRSATWHSLFAATIEQYAAQMPRVLMTGFDGDSAVGGNNPFYYWRFLKTGKLRSFLHEFRAHRQSFNMPLRLALTAYLLSPVLVDPLRLALQPLRPLIRGKKVWLPEWVHEDLVRRTNLEEWTQHQTAMLFANKGWPGIQNWRDPAKRNRYVMLTDPRSPRLRLWMDRMAMSYGAEMWNPWDDTRLAEYVLAIPEDELARGIDHKLILRKAMSSLLPREVLEWRGLKTGPAIFTNRYYANRDHAMALSRVLSDSLASRHRFLDVGKLQKAIHGLVDGTQKLSSSLWTALSLELWLKLYHGSAI